MSIFTAFKFATAANLNQGVIAGLFTSSVAFTALLFWYLYSEKLSLKKVAGMLLIVASVFCVGFR